MTVLETTVFSDSINGGNPCPIIFGQEELSTDQMINITKHLGFESLYIFSSSKEGVEYNFRYFVPNHEMEMCVHATIAGVTFLVQSDLVKKKIFKIETLLGCIQIKWNKNSDESILVTVRQFAPEFSQNNPSKKEVAECLDINPEIIDTNIFPLQSVSTSRYKLIVPLIDEKYLHNLRPNFKKLWTLCDNYNTTGLYPFSLQTNDSRYDFEARQFPNNVGYNEDPATGVAACALGAYITKYSKEIDYNGREITIGQGKSMDRQSKIIARASIKKDNTFTEVSGYAKILGHKILPVIF